MNQWRSIGQRDWAGRRETEQIEMVVCVQGRGSTHDATCRARHDLFLSRPQLLTVLLSSPRRRLNCHCPLPAFFLPPLSSALL